VRLVGAEALVSVAFGGAFSTGRNVAVRNHIEIGADPLLI